MLDAHRRSIAVRWPPFVLAWLLATVLFVIVLGVETPAAQGPGLLLCLVQAALAAGAIAAVRRCPEAPWMQAVVVATCAAFGLSSMAFYVHLGDREPIVVMMFFALGVTTSLLFAWRWYAALALFAATYGPWLVVIGPTWEALRLTPLQGLAGLAVGVAVSVVIAEGAFASVRAALLERMHAADRARELQDSRDALRELARGQARVREEERTRLGLDLHDDVCQELVGVGILIESVRARVADGPERADLARAVRYLNEMSEHLRRLAGELGPLQLADLGLEACLRSLVAGLKSSELAATATMPQKLPRLDPEIEIAVYRIAQEALTNAKRHGCAQRIEIVLALDGPRVVLDVLDDGRGFDPTVARACGLGLTSMEERALAVGGDLAVRSRPGAGTTIRLTCPRTLAASAA
jgi:signal transduction histidine kinase